MTVHDIWTAMLGDKGDIIDRSRQYARWTVPSVMPEEGSENSETEKANVMQGARLVNHLANKVVNALFPISRTFFTIAPLPEAERDLMRENKGREQEVKAFLQASTAMLEKAALRELKLPAYRPTAIMAAKHLIITGNAKLRRMPSGKRIQYPLDRYCDRRTQEGDVFETVLLDHKRFASFQPEMQDMLRQVKPEVEDEDILELFTHYIKEADGRWKITQEVETMQVGDIQYQTEADYDLLSLVWNLNPGEDYGRGLVEDNVNIFHNIDVTTDAVLDIISIMADIKFFVKPASITSQNIQNLNDAPRGSYHLGNGEDVTTPDLKMTTELQVMVDSINAWDQELSKAFLMSSVRDAERVTAEEIRMIASELEAAYGGIYSKLATDWQQREAQYLIDNLDFESEVSTDQFKATFEVVVTTGLETLSREGQLQALRLAIADLQMLDAVPEDIRGEIHPARFASYVFTNRGVTIEDFFKTMEEKEIELDQQMKLNQQALNQQANANVAEEAGKQQAQSV